MNYSTAAAHGRQSAFPSGLRDFEP